MRPILYMAPIMGITGCVYRNVYSRFFKGYDIAVMPFIANSKGGASTLRDILPERNNVNFELIPQVLDKKPETFITLAKRVYDMGYHTINWNLGCPLPKVRKKKKGSGLLPHADEIIGLLNKIIPAIPNKVSIKTRLGASSKNDLPGLLPALNDIPLHEIVIHPRTGEQMYTGEADISAFAECLSLSRHTIVYSGDIYSPEIYKILQKRFPVIDRWMIGRGGIINPFLPEQIKNIDNKSRPEKLDHFLSFHRALLEGYQKELSGQSHLIGKMKEVWRYWVQAFEGGGRLFMDLSRTKTLNKYLDTVEKFFRKSPGSRY